MDIEIPGWWKLLLKVSLLFIGVLIFLGIRKVEPRIRKIAFFIIIMLLCSIVLLSTVTLYTPRYWIGIYSGILFLMIYLILHSPSVKNVNIILAFVVMTFSMGIFSVPAMKRDWYPYEGNELKAFDQLYISASNQNVKALFFTEHDIQWKWNYLYGDKIPATYFNHKERTSFFQNQVEKIFTENAHHVGITGLEGIPYGLDQMEEFNQKRQNISIKYYLVPDAGKKLIEQGYNTLE